MLKLVTRGYTIILNVYYQYSELESSHLKKKIATLTFMEPQKLYGFCNMQVKSNRGLEYSKFPHVIFLTREYIAITTTRHIRIKWKQAKLVSLTVISVCPVGYCNHSYISTSSCLPLK